MVCWARRRAVTWQRIRLFFVYYTCQQKENCKLFTFNFSQASCVTVIFLILRHFWRLYWTALPRESFSLLLFLHLKSFRIALLIEVYQNGRRAGPCSKRDDSCGNRWGTHSHHTYPWVSSLRVFWSLFSTVVVTGRKIGIELPNCGSCDIYMGQYISKTTQVASFKSHSHWQLLWAIKVTPHVGTYICRLCPEPGKIQSNLSRARWSSKVILRYREVDSVFNYSCRTYHRKGDLYSEDILGWNRRLIAIQLW